MLPVACLLQIIGQDTYIHTSVHPYVCMCVHNVRMQLLHGWFTSHRRLPARTIPSDQNSDDLSMHLGVLSFWIRYDMIRFAGKASSDVGVEGMDSI